MATQGEEVVVGFDGRLVVTQELVPDRRQELFDGAARGTPGCLVGARLGELRLVTPQRGPVDLATGGEGQCGERHEEAGNHVGRQAPAEEGAQLGAGRERASGRHAERFLLLLPSPIPIFALFGWFFVKRSSRRDSTMVSSAYRRRHEAARLPAWRQLETSLRGGSSATWWGRWWKPLGSTRPGEEGDAEHHRRALYRLKTLLLFFEAGALGWAWSRYAGRALPMSETLYDFSMGLVVIGLVISSVSVALRTTGRVRALQAYARQPYGRYLSLAPACWWPGWYLGTLVALGDATEMGQREQLIGMAGFFVSATAAAVVGLSVGLPRSSELQLALWMALFLSMVSLGIVTQFHPGVADLNMDFLRALFIAAPFLSLLVGLSLAHWLLRPHRGRDVFDRGRGVGQRAGLAFLALTAALPCGALAIPAWLWVRHLLRLETVEPAGDEVREVPDQRETAPAQTRHQP